MATPDVRVDARTALIQSGERLFAERGINSVSLREVNRAAEQRNSMALHYHFGDRDGLVRAILERHEPDLAARRHGAMDQWETSGGGDVRALIGALVLPLVAKVSDPDGGPEYLQIASQVLNRTTHTIAPADLASVIIHDPTKSLERWSDLVAPFMPAASVGGPFHRRFVAIRFTYNEIGRRALEATDDAHRAFASDLTDLVHALLVTPPSTQTTKLMEE